MQKRGQAPKSTCPLLLFPYVGWRQGSAMGPVRCAASGLKQFKESFHRGRKNSVASGQEAEGPAKGKVVDGPRLEHTSRHLMHDRALGKDRNTEPSLDGLLDDLAV